MLQKSTFFDKKIDFDGPQIQQIWIGKICLIGESKQIGEIKRVQVLISTNCKKNRSKLIRRFSNYRGHQYLKNRFNNTHANKTNRSVGARYTCENRWQAITL